MAREIPDASDATVYEYEAPKNKTLRGDVEEQDWRDQLFAMSAGVFIAALGVVTFGVSHPGRVVCFLIAGLFIGTGQERYRIMRPDSGVLGRLRGGDE